MKLALLIICLSSTSLLSQSPDTTIYFSTGQNLFIENKGQYLISYECCH